MSSRFRRKTQWQMFLLVFGRYVGAHPDGHKRLRKLPFLLAPRRLGRFARGNSNDSSRQQQKFHTYDVNQCLHNKSGSHGFQMQIWFNFAFLLVHFDRCCVHLPTSSSKTQMLLLGKNIFQKYWLFCYRFTAFTFDLCDDLAFVCHS